MQAPNAQALVCDYVMLALFPGEDTRMSEIIFAVEDAAEGGYSAQAVGVSRYTQADTIAALRDSVRDAVRCHFDGDSCPKLIHLHFVRDEVIAA